MTETGRVRRDVKFRNQIRDSAASGPRNIAEGWGRYYPVQNAPYVRIAKGSLEETVNHLFHGKKRKYFAPEDFDKAFRLADRALGATTRYLLYLESCEKDPPKERREDATDRKTPSGNGQLNQKRQRTRTPNPEPRAKRENSEP